MGIQAVFSVARSAFRRQSTYRGATIAGIFTNSVFGLVMASILLTVFRSRSDVQGLSREEALTLVFFSQGMLVAVGAFGWRELAERVRDGSVVTDLLRPMNPSVYWGSMFVGAAMFSLVARGVPPFVVGSLVYGTLFPTSILGWLGVVLTLIGAVVLASRWWFLVNVASFWMAGDIRGVVQSASIIQMTASGSFLPLQFFPGWFGSVLRAGPFAAMVQLPGEVFVGRQAAGPVLAAQVAWIAVLQGAGVWFLRRGSRRLVIQGG